MMQEGLQVSAPNREKLRLSAFHMIIRFMTSCSVSDLASSYLATRSPMAGSVALPVEEED